MTATTQTPAQPSTIEAGQRWTFVDSDGKRTEYVVVDPSDPEQMDEATTPRFGARWEEPFDPQHVVYLLNEKTGKYAMVTVYWLRGIPARPDFHHWLPGGGTA